MLVIISYNLGFKLVLETDDYSKLLRFAYSRGPKAISQLITLKTLNTTWLIQIKPSGKFVKLNHNIYILAS